MDAIRTDQIWGAGFKPASSIKQSKDDSTNVPIKADQ